MDEYFVLLVFHLIGKSLVVTLKRHKNLMLLGSVITVAKQALIDLALLRRNLNVLVVVALYLHI